MEKQRVRVIFTHTINKGKSFCFLEIPNDLEFKNFFVKGESSEGFRFLSFEGIKFKKGMNPGAVFELYYSETNSSYSFYPSATPIARWSNTLELAKWEALYKADQRDKENLKSLSNNEIAHILDPLKSAYKEANYRQKELILAQIIRVVTS